MDGGTSSTRSGSGGAPGARLRGGLVLCIAALGLLSACGPRVLSGRITDATTGATRAGVEVTAHSSESGAVVARTVTDEDGAYRFHSSVLPDGDYRVQIDRSTWWQDAEDFAGATDVTVSDRAATTLDAAVALGSGSVAGTVTGPTYDPRGEPLPPGPLPGVTVEAVSEVSGTPLATTVSATDGTYMFADLPPGDYRIRFSRRGYTTRFSGAAVRAGEAPVVVVEAGRRREAVDTELDFGSVLSGSIRELHAAGAPVDVRAAAIHAEDPELAAVTDLGPGSAFLFDDLNPGTYRVVLFGGPERGEELLRPILVGATPEEPFGQVFTVATDAPADTGTVRAVGRDCDPTRFHTGADLAGADLRGLSLIGCDLAGADLSGADLSGAMLLTADLVGADLTGATFTGAELAGVQAEDAVAVGADLSGLPLAHSLWQRADLTDADLSGSDLTAAYFTAADLSRADLSGADLTGATLTSATLAGAELDATRLTGVRSGAVGGAPTVVPAGWRVQAGYLLGPGADLAGAALTSQDLRGVDLSGADLEGAALRAARLDGVTLVGADLGYADLTQADLTGAIAQGARLSWVTATGASLRGADLAGADLTWADLSGADLGDADLTGAQLTFAVLGGTDLSSADLTDADLAFAQATGATVAAATLHRTDLYGVTGGPSGDSTADHLDTTCPDGTLASAPATCVGRGLTP